MVEVDQLPTGTNDEPVPNIFLEISSLKTHPRRRIEGRTVIGKLDESTNELSLVRGMSEIDKVELRTSYGKRNLVRIQRSEGQYTQTSSMVALVANILIGLSGHDKTHDIPRIAHRNSPTPFHRQCSGKPRQPVTGLPTPNQVTRFRTDQIDTTTRRGHQQASVGQNRLGQRTTCLAIPGPYLRPRLGGQSTQNAIDSPVENTRPDAPRSPGGHHRLPIAIECCVSESTETSGSEYAANTGRSTAKQAVQSGQDGSFSNPTLRGDPRIQV